MDIYKETQSEGKIERSKDLRMNRYIYLDRRTDRKINILTK